MSNIKKMPTVIDPLAFIADGFSVWTPQRANTAFNMCRYERNRKETQATGHIDALARQMVDGVWLPRQQIDFAQLPSGKLILVNGHHRLLAQVKAGVDIEWSVVVHQCANDEQVASLFWRFDTVLRKRTASNIFAAVDAAENLGVSKTVTAKLAAAVTFIDNGMRPVSGHSTRIYSPSEKLELMFQWKHEAQVYNECISPAATGIQKKMTGAQVMAVALVTIRNDEKGARDFWGVMAKDDGLRRGDPRKTLLDFLRDTHAAGTGYTATAVACARAWSAFKSRRDLSMIRVGSAPVRIVTTSYTVKP